MRVLFCIIIFFIVIVLTFSIGLGLGTPFPPVEVKDTQVKQKTTYPKGYMSICNKVWVYCIRSDDDKEYEGEWYRHNIRLIIDTVPMLD